MLYEHCQWNHMGKTGNLVHNTFENIFVYAGRWVYAQNCLTAFCVEIKSTILTHQVLL